MTGVQTCALPIFDHRDQRLFVALDAGRVQAVFQDLEEFIGQRRMPAQPGQGAGVGEVEVQPQESCVRLGRCRAFGECVEPRRRGFGRDGLRAARGGDQVAADQARCIGAIGGGRVVTAQRVGEWASVCDKLMTGQ